MVSRLLLFILSFSVLSLACQRNLGHNLEPLDLTIYGLPMKILAPDSALVLKKEYDIMRDITVRQGNWYFIQIFESPATTTDPAEIKRSQLESIMQDKYFRDLIQEDEDGFIFQKILENDQIDYDFRYIKILNDQEIIFQTGIIGTFTLEQVQRMYKAVGGKL